MTRLEVIERSAGASRLYISIVKLFLKTMRQLIGQRETARCNKNNHEKGAVQRPYKVYFIWIVCPAPFLQGGLQRCVEL
ncbi:hypothetical protein D1839_14000 [Roseburia sp. 1XD42-34]|nr:hypothetical protein [Roseburia sp. 1XD42-34]RKI76585.1 hypothetical protein D7V87_12790 [Clostridium sp. 1xD42-85]